MPAPLLESDLPNRAHRGKVRDTYDLGDRLLIVATDRISAFDVVLPNGVPRKGEVLTRLSAWWFERIRGVVPNHFIALVTAENADEIPLPLDERYFGRSMLVRKAKRLDAECIVRGYLAGSGWKEYQRSGTICGIELAEGLHEADRLPDPIFTPTTKAESGHDMDMTYDELVALCGEEAANAMRVRSLALYGYAQQLAADRGVIIGDTKFEFGYWGDEVIVIDEVSPRTVRASGRSPATSPAAPRSASTSSPCATGWPPAAGRTATRRPRCPPPWSKPRPSAIWPSTAPSPARICPHDPADGHRRALPREGLRPPQADRERPPGQHHRRRPPVARVRRSGGSAQREVLSASRARRRRGRRAPPGGPDGRPPARQSGDRVVHLRSRARGLRWTAPAPRDLRRFRLIDLCCCALAACLAGLAGGIALSQTPDEELLSSVPDELLLGEGIQLEAFNGDRSKLISEKDAEAVARWWGPDATALKEAPRLVAFRGLRDPQAGDIIERPVWLSASPSSRPLDHICRTRGSRPIRVAEGCLHYVKYLLRRLR